MTPILRTLLAAAFLVAAPLLHAQATESAINKQLGKLRSLSATQRPVASIKLAADIRALPAGPSKVNLADRSIQELANLTPAPTPPNRQSSLPPARPNRQP